VRLVAYFPNEFAGIGKMSSDVTSAVKRKCYSRRFVICDLDPYESERLMELHKVGKHFVRIIAQDDWHNEVQTGVGNFR
jgi:hypothetical protein